MSAKQSAIIGRTAVLVGSIEIEVEMHEDHVAVRRKDGNHCWHRVSIQDLLAFAEGQMTFNLV